MTQVVIYPLLSWSKIGDDARFWTAQDLARVMTSAPPVPIFLFGSPRSGTSWLGRIFDSHPDTVYRHEPDAVIAGAGVPFVMRHEDIEALVPKFAPYVEQWLALRSARCNGLLPQFPKRWRGGVAQSGRLGLVYLYRVLDRVARSKSFANRFPIPDFASRSAAPVPVAKSVNSLGRLPLLAQTVDDCRIILIVRHPGGVISSGLRGFKLGKMGEPSPFPEWLKLSPARQRGLDDASLAGWSHLETLSWQWLLFNEYVLNKLSDDARFLVIRYEDLCNDPHTVTAQMFEHAGLTVSEQTRGFIDACINYTGGSPGYFQTIRNPRTAMSRWKDELSDAQKSEIKTLVAASEPGKLFYD